jgi:hypothetical protein
MYGWSASISPRAYSSVQLERVSILKISVCGVRAEPGSKASTREETKEKARRRDCTKYSLENLLEYFRIVHDKGSTHISKCCSPRVTTRMF